MNFDLVLAVALIALLIMAYWVGLALMTVLAMVWDALVALVRRVRG